MAMLGYKQSVQRGTNHLAGLALIQLIVLLPESFPLVATHPCIVDFMMWQIPGKYNHIFYKKIPKDIAWTIVKLAHHFFEFFIIIDNLRPE